MLCYQHNVDYLQFRSYFSQEVPTAALNCFPFLEECFVQIAIATQVDRSIYDSVLIMTHLHRHLTASALIYRTCLNLFMCPVMHC